MRRYVASIAVAHRVLGCTGTLKSPAVRLALKRMHRCRGRRQGQAHGLTWPLRQRLVEAAGDRPIDILKAMARRAGLPETVVQGLSGHSARVGAAQDMIAAGIELPAILQAGRWKSTAMVNRYGERLLARRSGAAQLARLQRRE